MLRIPFARTRFEVGTTVAWLAVAALFTGGCSVYKLTGNVMSSYAADELVPFMMSSDDVNMACQTGVSMGSFLMSFQRVTDPPDRAALVSLVSAAMCAEAQGWNAELRRLRATRAAQVAEAQDALVEEKEAHALAAARYYAAWKRLNHAMGPVGEGACPKLAENDELFYLLGLSSGVLAVMHDMAADGVVGVPMDIPAAVVRAAPCLSNARWWGVPAAIEAAVWIVVPPLRPAGQDPWSTLADAVKAGEQAHVRLASAFEVQSEMTAGRRDAAEKSIAAFVAAEQAAPADPKWRLLDAYGASMILHESDKIWTEETGHRTPFGQLGMFPGAPAAPVGADPFSE